MSGSTSLGFKDSLFQTYSELTSQIVAFSPKLLGGIVLLLVGWGLAWFLRMFTRNLVMGLDTLFKRWVGNTKIGQDRLKQSYSNIAGQTVFWITLLFSVAASANYLGWDLFSTWVNNTIGYLPNLISGLLIILAGILLSQIAKTTIVSAVSNTGITQGYLFAHVAQIVILVTVLVVGIEQIGISVDFLTNVLIVILGVLLGGGALAFSFGARDFVANIVAAQNARKHCRIGEIMSLRNIEGTIVEITKTSIVLETDSGRAVVPAKYCLEDICQFSSPVDQASAATETSS